MSNKLVMRKACLTSRLMSSELSTSSRSDGWVDAASRTSHTPTRLAPRNRRSLEWPAPSVGVGRRVVQSVLVDPVAERHERSLGLIDGPGHRTYDRER